MASFSSHHHHHQQQPVFLPVVDTFLPSELEQFYYSFRDTEIPNNQEGCSVNNNGTSTTQSSCVQNNDINNKKRKSRHDGPSSNSTNSKGAKQVKPKKQKGDKEAMNEDEISQNKASEEGQGPKGYIHVRARRGQATDSHSLAERVRREKISKKMGTLQALVPGCDKVTGKALMLDEIINYVQSLQNQVEFLSMKLASVDPMVYTFGLMDHDPIVFPGGLQGMNPLIESTGANTSGNTSPTQAFHTSNSCLASPATSSTLISPTLPIHPHVDASTNLPQLEHHKPNFFPFQDVGSSYWGINEQERQSIINQFGLSDNNNNLYSLN